MFRVDPETRQIIQGEPTAEFQEVAAIVIDGTHSALKTLPIDAYAAMRPLIADEECDLGSKRSTMRPYRLSCIGEEIDSVIAPVVIYSEEARRYGESMEYLGRKVLTDDYNAADQARINLQVWSGLSEAVMTAASMARKLQPGRERPISLVISDRSPISGFSYANVLLPGEEHRFWDLRTIAGLYDGGEAIIDLAAWCASLTLNADRVLLANYTEVPLEDDGQRKSDLLIRAAVAADIEASYTTLFASRPEVLRPLRGSLSRRRNTIKQEARRLLRAQLAAAEA